MISIGDNAAENLLLKISHPLGGYDDEISVISSQ